MTDRRLLQDSKDLAPYWERDLSEEDRKILLTNDRPKQKGDLNVSATG